MFPGQVICGAVVSTTVTLNEHWAWFPEVSVAVQVTVVTPRRKVEPLLGTQLTGGVPQLSVADGTAKETAALQLSAGVLAVILPGQALRTGSSWSETITLKV